VHGPRIYVEISDDHSQFNTPDCFHVVVVDYEAGFNGTIMKNSSVTKIDGCRPSGGGYECDTGATLDHSGNPCAGFEPPNSI